MRREVGNLSAGKGRSTARRRSGSVASSAAEKRQELALDFVIAGIAERSAGDHDEVLPRTDRRAVTTESLSNQSLAAIAPNGSADLSTRDDSEAGQTSVPGQSDQDEQPSLHAAPLREGLLELRAPQQASLPRECRRTAGHRSRPGGPLYGMRRLRPRRRRRESTFRPPGVAIRARKPCTFLRRLRFG